MKITHNKVGQNLNLTDSNKADRAKDKSPLNAVSTESQTQNLKEIASASKGEAAQVKLSERAQDIRQAKELAMAAPDVDMEKVEKLRKLIDEGKYKVDAKAVADRMVNDGLLNLGQTNNE